MFCKKLEQRVISSMRAQKLVDANDTILVGVSGGSDSLFLLNLLSRYKKELKINIICCHINHGLRGKTSMEDEHFVEQYATGNGIPFVARRVDVASYSREQQCSLEDAGRRLRLNALADERKKHGAQKVALGHTADDAIETFLMNLLRGAGRTGLSGIRARRGDIIHPLLCLRRREIIRYLKERGIGFRVDVSNWHTEFKRNAMRHELIPLLEKRLQRNVRSNILQLIEIMQREDMVLEELADRAFAQVCMTSGKEITLNRRDFKELSPALQSRMIMRCFSDMVHGEERLNFREVEAIRKYISGISSGAVFPVLGVSFLVGTDTILVSRKGAEAEGTHEEISLGTSVEIAFLGRYRIRTSIIKEINGDIGNPDCAYFDLEKLVLPLALRTRRNGDAFTPFGMDHRKKVKELFIDEKVPFWERNTIPIVSDAREIIWIAGVRRGAAAKVDSGTKKILKVEMMRHG